MQYYFTINVCERRYKYEFTMFILNIKSQF